MELTDAEAVLRVIAGGLARKPDPEALDALYRSLPRMECKGKCASCCGPAPASPLERQRVTARGVDWVDGAPVTLPSGESLGLVCTALDTKELRCRVYEDRPMICRLWGLVKALECPWGCVPEGGHLDSMEGLRLLNLSQWYGGAAGAVDPEKWEELVARPKARQALVRYLARSRPVREEPQIVQATIRVRRAS